MVRSRDSYQVTQYDPSTTSLCFITTPKPPEYPRTYQKPSAISSQYILSQQTVFLHAYLIYDTEEKKYFLKEIPPKNHIFIIIHKEILLKIWLSCITLYDRFKYEISSVIGGQKWKEVDFQLISSFNMIFGDFLRSW